MNVCYLLRKTLQNGRAMGNAKRELVMVIRKCVDFFFPEEKKRAIDEVTLRFIKWQHFEYLN